MPFYRFSSTPKSPYMCSVPLSHPEVYPRSFLTLLENLILGDKDRSSRSEDDPYEPQAVVPLAPPMFTGLLCLAVYEKMEYAGTRQLLGPPNSLHF